MATCIRLSRCGAKKKPFYRIVVADRESARDAKFLEIVGQYNPHKGVDAAVLKKDRIDWWLSKGAQPSDTVRRILRG